MKILATSDLHGRLPEIEPCDILLIGGDVCPMNDHTLEHQAHWLVTEFRDWLQNIPAKHIVGIAGNHDFIAEDSPKVMLGLPWTYLCDTSTEIEGVWIYGTPWVPNLKRWAFYGGEGACSAHDESIPEADIILAHGPFYGYCDVVGPMYGGPRHVGCTAMAKQVERIKPKAYVCGHIHEAYGHQHHDSIEHGVYNVAHMTDRYEPINKVVEINAFDSSESPAL